jgi:uncharacterized protein YqgC (DUF456 family)
MPRKLKGLLLLLAGVACVFVGLAGLVLPIVPGIPILLLGLHLIGVRIPILDRQIQRFRNWLEARQNRGRSPRQP